MEMSSIPMLESEALKRKERLLMMKRKMAVVETGGEEKGETTSTGSFTEPDLKKPAFRSYKPSNETLKKDVVSAPMAEPGDVEIHIREQIESAKEVAVAGEIDLTALAPRKIDWDLKRDVEKKLQKLERQTQAAIAELIRERLASGKEELLLSAVNSRARVDEERHLSDDDD